MGIRDASARGSSLVCRFKRQEDKEFELGSWKSEVSLRCWARPMPRKLRRVWQQDFPRGSMHTEWSHGRVST